MISFLLMLFQLAATLDVGKGFASDCLDPAFEARYADLSKRPQLSFGVTVLLDYRYTDKITPEQLQIALDTANGFYRNARVRLVDLRVERLAAEFAPEVSQQGDWAKTSEARWRQAAAPFLGKGRLVAVLAQTRSVNGGAYIEGKLLGPHPLNQTGVADGVPPLLWVNVDPDDTQTAPFFSTFTLIHELGHRFGLLHTFETRFGCELGDIIEDTGPASNRLGECSEGGLDACRTQRDSLDFSNYMSYGRCRVGTPFTAGQYRRMRCVIENHLADLTVLADSGVADQPVVVATPPPTGVAATTTVRATPAPTTKTQRCNGIRGSCIDTSRSRCALPTIAGRCTGAQSIQCCPSDKAPFVTPLPGVGTACLSVAGVCQDTENPFQPPCATGYLPGKCIGPRQVQCCPTAGQTMPTGPSITIDNSNQVEFADTIQYPIGYTVHVGSQLWAPVSTTLSNVVGYLVPMATVHKPTADELSGREIPIFFNTNPNGAIARLWLLKSGASVDRGDFVFVVAGTDGAGLARQFVSTLITVDVNSCPVDLATYNVPYGLVRTSAACAARSGEIASTTSPLPTGTVCCVSALVSSGFTARPSVDGSSPASPLRVAWRGLTSFWGAPMTVTLKSAAREPVPLLLMSATAAQTALPPVAFNLAAAADAQDTITPMVAAPGVFVLADADANYASTSFSVVSLPCRLSSNIAGYCMPRQPIVGSVFGATPSTMLCPGGELAPCAELSVGNIQFACCIASASALQKQASYLQSLDGDEESATSDSLSVATWSALAALWALVSLVL